MILQAFMTMIQQTRQGALGCDEGIRATEAVICSTVAFALETTCDTLSDYFQIFFLFNVKSVALGELISSFTQLKIDSFRSTSQRKITFFLLSENSLP